MPLHTLIDPERLRHIPPEFHMQHEFCFRLHDMIADVIRQAEQKQVTAVTIHFQDAAERDSFQNAEDVIKFLLDNGRVSDAKRVVINQIVIPLYADLVHFVYEALMALEKHKYTVAFALLRKPLKYSLMFATWVFADEEDFFNRLRQSPADMLSDGDQNLSKSRRIELINAANQRLDVGQFFSGDAIYSIVFDRSDPRGLAGLFDKAVHLVTSHPAIRTEQFNLNFIFKNPNDTDIYDSVYLPLSYVLMYLFCLQIATMGRLVTIPESYKAWFRTAIFGCYEALFGTTNNIIDGMNSDFGNFLKCFTCGSQIVVTRENATLFFLAELIECPACKTEQEFPLFWLLRQSESLGTFTSAKDATRADDKTAHGTS